MRKIKDTTNEETIKNENQPEKDGVESSEVTIEEKLKNLYELQKIETQLDNIEKLRGELPMEVEDLEDELTGAKTRYQKFLDEIDSLEKKISAKKIEIKNAEAKIKKYTEQQKDVRNNREYDALNKEIEFQQLEIQLCEKNIKEFQAMIEKLKPECNQVLVLIEKLSHDLQMKQKELQEIIKETEKEEEIIKKKIEKIERKIDPRLLTAFKRIRKNMKNGLAVVKIERDACGGCFAKIPPQRQLEIKMRKKIIVCEYCGRILVDPDIDKN
ncbi:MAG: C4-type zinc ribbon domain-containing protein [Bacteroidales bacterium]|nr:C4-type zinc ribbon domain-containing protein [Bacteroidales bacterium]